MASRVIKQLPFKVECRGRYDSRPKALACKPIGKCGLLKAYAVPETHERNCGVKQHCKQSGRPSLSSSLRQRTSPEVPMYQYVYHGIKKFR